MTHRNTKEGYEPENVTLIPDEEDPGVGFAAGDRVRVEEDDEMYPGEEGEVWAIGRGQGWYGGQLVIDVLIDGTEEPQRFRAEMLSPV